MDRQEAIEKLSTIGHISVSYAEDLYDSFFPKPAIPQFVADWIKYCKFTNVNLGRALFISDIVFYNYESQEDCSKLKEFLGTETNQETFALAWTLGYEVEKEKRYRVSMPKTRNRKDHAQLLCEANGKVFWCGEWYRLRTKFTRKELEEAGFEWVFDCEGVEVKEVTDE